MAKGGVVKMQQGGAMMGPVRTPEDTFGMQPINAVVDNFSAQQTPPGYRGPTTTMANMAGVCSCWWCTSDAQF